MFLAYLFLSGLVLGSFFNATGRRIPGKISLIFPRSSCPVCRRKLTSLELIPVLSYLFLRGKCKGCKSPVSILYPAVELLTALLFVLAGLRFKSPGELLLMLALFSLLLIVLVSDIAYMVIPDAILCFFLPFFVIGRMLVPLEPWYSGLTGAAAGLLLPFIVKLFAKDGIGGGDVKLFAVIGFVLGARLIFPVFFISAAAGTLLGFAGMIAGKVKGSEPIPFAPAILIGTVIVCFYGEPLIDSYIELLHI
ncbi:A24 family peptidase [Bacillus sp. HSf4]|uniref:prepilin peptidase n=1 Tax=Bacillus sp. HSf4 TaxID=3035514 RepID=UPI0024097119|nr:A24 family peptidase [Bacillus sp. HSf4]WFA04003.1 prepilin peptidase [Bacillus sp. HSf4]